VKNDDSGVTLVELLVCIGIMGIIFAALTTGFIAASKSISQSSARMANTHDSQIAQSFFASDMQNANIVSTNDLGCPGSGTLLISFTWFGFDDTQSPPIAVRKAASYRVIEPGPSGTERQLVRQYCQTIAGFPLAPSTLVVAHNLADAPNPTVVCSSTNDPSVNAMTNAKCNGTPEVAQLTATAKARNADSITQSQTTLVYVLQATRRVS
jgi:prepilin-type N-terminal cleavage/methylation domain-containing protein